MNVVGDLYSLTTFDGVSTIFPDATTAFLTTAGFGAPPIDWLTQQSYTLHGELEIDIFLLTRSVSVHLWQKSSCSRQQYWDNRAQLHDFLRPNRGGPLVLTVIQLDGKKRSLTVRANPGLDFSKDGEQNNSWMVDEVVEFEAFDPIWFDPVPSSISASGLLNANLVFPITFPIQFDRSGLHLEATIPYTGTWASFPTITIRGPYTSVVIHHETLDRTIRLVLPITENELRRVILTPGSQRVVDGSGVSRFEDLDPTSNLVDFALLPFPLVENGVSQITVSVQEPTIGLTSSEIEYYTRFFGI